MNEFDQKRQIVLKNFDRKMKQEEKDVLNLMSELMLTVDLYNNVENCQK